MRSPDEYKGVFGVPRGNSSLGMEKWRPVMKRKKAKREAKSSAQRNRTHLVFVTMPQKLKIRVLSVADLEINYWVV